MIVIDGVPRKTFFYRLYLNGELVEAVVAERILTVEEESLLYMRWATEYGAPGPAFVHWIAMRELHKDQVETGAQQRMRHAETGYMKNSFKDQPHVEKKPDSGYGFDEKEYGYDPGHPGGDWSAFWYRRQR